MDISQFIYPVMGGVLIGFAASLLLLLKGRVFGISGIVAGVALPKVGDTNWRWGIVAGLLTAGALLMVLFPDAMDVAGHTPGSLGRYAIAGLLVGFGTRLGSGCTSGHGVCGVSRLSPRSLIATLAFIGAGILTVAVMRQMGMLS